MRSLWKIIRRYSMSAGLIVFVILLCNFGCLWYLIYSGMGEMGTGLKLQNDMEQFGRELVPETGGTREEEQQKYELTDEGRRLLNENGFLWAMALDQKGNIVWEWQLPAEIRGSYGLQEVASFTRWYLEDYPVRVWSYGDLLLVFGRPEGLFAKYNVEFPLEFIENLFFYVRLLLLLNILLVVLFVLCFGYQFYRTLRPVAEGIEKLSCQEPVNLKESGTAGELAGKLNQASVLLERQSRRLEQRDRARTEWITGVSHDIRTPLALIMGYTDQLSDGCDTEKTAAAIRRQSLIIRRLIQDMNLTSKLACGAQPLRRSLCLPAKLLRECAADLYNEGIEQNYEIEVRILGNAEQAFISVDEGLLKRALRNLIGNSIRHNPQGCRIEIALRAESGCISYAIWDTGPGISENVVQELKLWETVDGRNSEGFYGRKGAVHIMGLRLAQEIARAHGGELLFDVRECGTYDARLEIKQEILWDLTKSKK